MASPLRQIQRLKQQARGVIHVGASRGQEVEDYAAAGLGGVVLVEPLDEPFRQLSAAVADRPGFVAVQAVCSDVDGRAVTLHVASNGGESSSILAPAAHTVVHSNVLFETTQTLKSKRLDTLVAEVRRADPVLAAQLDTLVLDVQGAELLVLKGGLATLDQIDFVYCEVSHLELYAGNAMFYQLIAFLDAFGFRLFHCQLNHKLYGDALFVRTTRLTKRFAGALAAQAQGAAS